MLAVMTWLMTVMIPLLYNLLVSAFEVTVGLLRILWDGILFEPPNDASTLEPSSAPESAPIELKENRDESEKKRKKKSSKKRKAAKSQEIDACGMSKEEIDKWRSSTSRKTRKHRDASRHDLDTAPTDRFSTRFDDKTYTPLRRSAPAKPVPGERVDPVEDTPADSPPKPKQHYMNSRKAYQWFHTVYRNVKEYHRKDLFLHQGGLPHEFAYILAQGWIDLEMCLEWQDGRHTIGQGMFDLAEQSRRGDEWVQNEMPMGEVELKAFTKSWMDLNRSPEERLPYNWALDRKDRARYGPFGPALAYYADTQRLEAIAQGLIDHEAGVDLNCFPGHLKSIFDLLVISDEGDDDLNSVHSRELESSEQATPVDSHLTSQEAEAGKQVPRTNSKPPSQEAESGVPVLPIDSHLTSQEAEAGEQAPPPDSEPLSQEAEPGVPVPPIDSYLASHEAEAGEEVPPVGSKPPSQKAEAEQQQVPPVEPHHTPQEVEKTGEAVGDSKDDLAWLADEIERALAGIDETEGIADGAGETFQGSSLGGAEIKNTEYDAPPQDRLGEMLIGQLGTGQTVRPPDLVIAGLTGGTDGRGDIPLSSLGATDLQSTGQPSTTESKPEQQDMFAGMSVLDAYQKAAEILFEMAAKAEAAAILDKGSSEGSAQGQMQSGQELSSSAIQVASSSIDQSDHMDEFAKYLASELNKDPEQGNGDCNMDGPAPVAQQSAPLTEDMDVQYTNDPQLTFQAAPLAYLGTEDVEMSASVIPEYDMVSEEEARTVQMEIEHSPLYWPPATQEALSYPQQSGPPVPWPAVTVQEAAAIKEEEMADVGSKPAPPRSTPLPLIQRILQRKTEVMQGVTSIGAPSNNPSPLRSEIPQIVISPLAPAFGSPNVSNSALPALSSTTTNEVRTSPPMDGNEPASEAATPSAGAYSAPSEKPPTDSGANDLPDYASDDNDDKENAAPPGPSKATSLASENHLTTSNGSPSEPAVVVYDDSDSEDSDSSESQAASPTIAPAQPVDPESVLDLLRSIAVEAGKITV